MEGSQEQGGGGEFLRVQEAFHVRTLSGLLWEHVPPIGGDRPLCNIWEKRLRVKTCGSSQKTPLVCQLTSSELPAVLRHEVLSTTTCPQAFSPLSTRKRSFWTTARFPLTR